jgi:hypothetical protein
MVVLLSAGASRYRDLFIDGATSPEYLVKTSYALSARSRNNTDQSYTYYRLTVSRHCEAHHGPDTVQHTAVQTLWSTPLSRHCAAHHCPDTVQDTAVQTLCSKPLSRHCEANHCPDTVHDTAVQTLYRTPLSFKVMKQALFQCLSLRPSGSYSVCHTVISCHSMFKMSNLLPNCAPQLLDSIKVTCARLHSSPHCTCCNAAWAICNSNFVGIIRLYNIIQILQR